MTERVPKYRPFMVVYKEYKCVNWMTKQEMEEKLLQGEVNQINFQGNLDSFELEVYRTKLMLENIQEKEVVGNKDIAEQISQFSKESISRDAVARARRRIAHKLGYQEGW